MMRAREGNQRRMGEESSKPSPAEDGEAEIGKGRQKAPSTCQVRLVGLRATGSEHWVHCKPM